MKLFNITVLTTRYRADLTAENDPNRFCTTPINPLLDDDAMVVPEFAVQHDVLARHHRLGEHKPLAEVHARTRPT